MKIFKNKVIIVFICLFVLLVVSILVSLWLGTTNISILDIAHLLLANDNSDLRQTIFYIRLPRIIMAIMTGAALAVSGCVFQAILKNPLTDPFTLGISGGAAFGAATAFVSGIFAITSAFIVPLFALCGVLISVFIVYMLSYYKDFDSNSMILSGVVVSYIFSSLVMLLYILAPSQSVHAAVMWLMGSLSYVDIKILPFISIFIFIGVLFLTFCGNVLNLVALGGDKSKTLGVNITRTIKLLFFVASAITAITVSVCGIIGFVGLMIPHIMKKIVGANNTILIPICAICGAIFLLICDTIARIIALPIQLPVGIVTSIIGGVFFIFLLVGVKRKI
ncbi:MAG: iron ABC transporter permease [Endomicrobium sp.]|jgi:iron complex transport system permease protein|nr:iron ABC transporter permease [Endomicrobium sp.]